MFEKVERVTFLKKGDFFSASIPLFAEIAEVSGIFCAFGNFFHFIPLFFLLYHYKKVDTYVSTLILSFQLCMWLYDYHQTCYQVKI